MTAATSVDLRLDNAALQRLLESEAGPVVLHLAQLATRVQEAAKANIKRGDPPREDSHLQDTVVKRFIRDKAGPAVWVGSEHPRALMYHEGTRPHVILPRNAKVLAFDVGGTTVFAAKVNHPGTPATKWLARALESVRTG